MLLVHPHPVQTLLDPVGPGVIRDPKTFNQGIGIRYLGTWFVSVFEGIVIS
jgi:hypothetical protein